MDKKALTVTVTVDTVYGVINKHAYCCLKPIDNKQVLGRFLKSAFGGLEMVILHEFETIENQNRVEGPSE